MAKGDKKFYENAGLIEAGKVVKTATDAIAPKVNAAMDHVRKVTSQIPLGVKDYDMSGIKMPAMPKTPSMPAMPQIGRDIADKAISKANTAIEKATNFGQRVSQMAHARRTTRTPRRSRGLRMGMRRNRADGAYSE